jgi:molybdenum cofactor cytidylyltransferase
MGAQKLTLPVAGRPLVEHALDAASGYPTVVVVSPAMAGRIPPATGRRIIINDAPERGMSHSLALAEEVVDDPFATLVVLLADTPKVDAALVVTVLSALGDNDVAFPVRDGVPGHPVVFGPRARRRISQLADGDTLRALRDDPHLKRVAVDFCSDAPFVDVDTPEDYLQLTFRERPPK